MLEKVRVRKFSDGYFRTTHFIYYIMYNNNLYRYTLSIYFIIRHVSFSFLLCAYRLKEKKTIKIINLYELG